MESNVKLLPDFSPTQQVMGCDGTSGLAIDEPRRKLCLIAHSGVAVTRRIISYKDIVSVELFEDGTSITKTVRSSQIGGAILGGLLLGGVGAIIGGLSGRTETSGKVKHIDLRLIVNDTNAPLHDVAFMNTEGNKGGFTYTQAIHLARHWHGIVEVLIKRADAEERSSQVSERVTAPALSGVSVADEIKKLADLHNTGLLTSDEFQQQKARVLGANTQPVSNELPTAIGLLRSIQIGEEGLLAAGELKSAQNALYHSIYADHVASLKKALQGVSSAEIKEKSYALLYFALFPPGGRSARFKVAAELVAMGADVHVTRTTQPTPDNFLDEPMENGLLETAMIAGRKDSEEIALWLLERMNELPKFYAESFMVRAAGGFGPRLLEAGRQIGGNVNERTSAEQGGLTPLIAAVQRNNLEAVKYLISVGADVNAVDEEGYSALSYVERNESNELEEILLNAGADPACKTLREPGREATANSQKHVDTPKAAFGGTCPGM